MNNSILQLKRQLLLCLKETMRLHDYMRTAGLSYTNGADKAEYRKYCNLVEDQYKLAKKHFADCIKEFCLSHNADVFVTSELRLRDSRPYREHSCVELHDVSVWNNKGAISPKARWLNKVTVRRGELVDHKARTDVAFMHPFDKNFYEFMQEVYSMIDELNKELYESPNS